MTLAWIGTFTGLIVVATFVLEGPAALAADLVGFVVFASRIVSERVAKLWIRLVMGWDDPWLRGSLPTPEGVYYEKLVGIVANVHRVDSERYKRGATARASELASALDELGLLEPPHEWAALQRDIEDHVTTLYNYYRTASAEADDSLAANADADAELYERWAALRDRIVATRNRRSLASSRADGA